MSQESLFKNESGGVESAFYQQESHANHIALQENVRHLVMNVICGRKQQELFARLNQDGFWEKMYQGYCQVSLDDSLEEYLETWPKWGIVLDGVAMRLPQPELTFTGKEYLLLPRPIASDGLAWTKINKNDCQTSIHKVISKGRMVKLIYYLIFADYSVAQSAEYYEMTMGFPKHWTDLNALETP